MQSLNKRTEFAKVLFGLCCRGTRDQTANISWIIKKAREFQKNIYFCFTDYTKVFDCVDHGYLGCEDYFWIVFLCILATSS